MTPAIDMGDVITLADIARSDEHRCFWDKLDNTPSVVCCGGVSCWDVKEEALGKLHEAKEVASGERIDIDVGSYYIAGRFIDLLPANMPVPDFDILDTGEVGVEWFVKGKGSLVAIVGDDGLLHYSGESKNTGSVVVGTARVDLFHKNNALQAFIKQDLFGRKW